MQASSHAPGQREPEGREPTAAPDAQPRFLDASNPVLTASVVREVMPAHGSLGSTLLCSFLAATLLVFELVHASAADTSGGDNPLAPAMPTSAGSAVAASEVGAPAEPVAPARILDDMPEVRFVGNNDISSDELRPMFTRRSSQSLVDDTGALSQEALDRDVLVLSAFYLDRGYANVKVGTPEVRLSRNEISIPIEEGPMFTMGAVAFTGDLTGGLQHHLAMLQARPGITFSRTMIADDRETLSTYYQDNGYADANVIPLTTVDLSNHTISLTFEITPGKVAHLGRINLRGDPSRMNALGQTIRRAMKIAPGDRFNATSIDEAKHRIETLTGVKHAVISTRRGRSDTRVDLDVEVELDE